MVVKAINSDYKQTDIGAMPIEWMVSSLKESCDLIKDGTHTPPKRIVSGIPLLSAVNIENGDIDFQNNVTYISEKDYKLIHKFYSIKRGDVLVTIVGTLGRLTLVNSDQRFSVQRSIAILRPHNNKIDNRYFFHILTSRKSQEQIIHYSKSTAQTGIYLSELAKIKIPIPPMLEQKRIAEILTKADALIKSFNVMISKKKNIKQGLMQKLVRSGIGHTKFKMTAIGEIPQEWDLRNIEQICQKPQYGFTESASFVHDGPKFLRITDIQDGAVNWNSVPFCNCSKEILEKYKLTSGDILFARTGATTGKSFIVKNPPVSIFASYLIRIRSKVVVNPVYLYMYLNSGAYWRQIKQRISGSAQGGVNASLLCKILVAVPPHPEQQKIAEILSDADKEIEALEQKRDKYKLFKMGMMQQLLTGRIRVND